MFMPMGIMLDPQVLPAKSRPDSPVKSRPDSPIKSRPDSPIKSRPDSPKKSRPVSPMVSRPGSPMFMPMGIMISPHVSPPTKSSTRSPQPVRPRTSSAEEPATAEPNMSEAKPAPGSVDSPGAGPVSREPGPVSGELPDFVTPPAGAKA
eukprot:2321088-Prymnesium_polylepis.1